MLFNSTSFAIFLPIVFLLYWFVAGRSYKLQNKLLLISSYFFYACWDWRFLFLLIFSTLLDYYTGIKMSEAKNAARRDFWFWLSISVNVGFLGLFKYYNFFITSFTELNSGLGFKINPLTLNIILPVGISFYTFHGLSYVIDIYKKRIPAERNFIDYALFVSFFPLLVAGPIERATHLLPQIQRARMFAYSEAIDGLKQILWGLFKKVVIADQCAEYANQIFNNSAGASGSTLAMGALFFTFQIYGDFSGYSDIALGTAKLFGIKLLRNFANPYFSRDIAEFWRRWHISLSSWFRDYLYIPLGGSKGGTWMKVRNTFIIFLVSGLWHGANWTFIVWGLLNALYIMPSIVLGTNRHNLEIVAKGRLLPSIKEFLSIGLTFMLIAFAWIFFRAENLTHAIKYVNGIFTGSFFSKPDIHANNLLLLLVIFMSIEWYGREQEHPIANLGTKWPRFARWATYHLIILSVLYFTGSKQQFIYFQF
ncbi:MBOAT family protein [Dyadobacter sp. CY326]|uniref:MBOAT family O-acyltransferase n=1 Tax=Dyadobacter sp. CY326 TaxID=2907300 RepID=UPI001F2F7AFD|nr:MBOAT family O-acyltransferase [Dyadobacter sp. CY326]MCE7063849.1 MBOAT family protein [Dyadobacter sp. CY326]